MFAMLHGPWPGGRPIEGDANQLVAEALTAQSGAGLDLLTDGLSRWPDPTAALLDALERGQIGDRGMLVEAWRSTAALPEALGSTVAAVVTGPCTLAAAVGDLAAAGQYGDLLAGELAALEAAGCPIVVIDEPAATRVGADDGRRAIYREAHRRLLARTPSLHAMLAVTGGSAWDAGAATILDAPYRSYLFDLVAGPDNWYLVRAAPGDRGIVCAALEAPSLADQAPLLVWAARYAASANGRGLDRVGVSNASSLEGLDPRDARRALEALARGARLASLDPQSAIEEGLDPRTFSQGPGRGARRRGVPPSA